MDPEVLKELKREGKKIVYFDMDGVLADFMSGVYKYPKEMQDEYEGRLDNLPGLFSRLDPVPGAIEAVKKIAKQYDVYILSTVPWSNKTGASDKIEWIKTYFGDIFRKKVVLSHNKQLNIGDYLIDDHTRNGAGEFIGEHIHFGTDKFPDWDAVCAYLLK